MCALVTGVQTCALPILLLDRYGAAGVVTGADFVFGKGRGGDVVTLADHARRLGFFTEMVAPVDDAEEVIPSSRIREALQSGDCETATRLLTRPFTVRGRVQHGDKNGRLLGFPTANLEMGQYLRQIGRESCRDRVCKYV